MNKPILTPVVSLLYSRKFLVAVVGVLAVVFNQFLPADLAESIVQLAMVLIGAIAVEDGLSKKQ